MMTKEEVLRSVRKAIAEAFELSEDKVSPDAHLYKDLDLDSLDAIDLAVRLKMDTGLSLSEQDLRAMRTVADVVDVIHAKLLASCLENR